MNQHEPSAPIEINSLLPTGQTIVDPSGGRSGDGAMSSPLHQILDRLRDVRRSGNGWIARCPAHEDEKPSLTIAEGADRKVLLKCMAGCPTDSVCRALGVELRDLFPAPPSGGNGRMDIVAEYDYTDEDGRLLFQTVRLQPKGFRQRKPDGDGWTWKLGDVRRVLFHLPRLNAADPSAIVFVVEGEKDVFSLERIGAIATTNAGGAGKWRKEYSKCLRARRVAILPDNDPPGRRHALEVAQSLYGVAASIKVLELPGIPGKGDVSDWLGNGGTRRELERLAQAAPEWAPGTTPPATQGQRRNLTDLGNAERLVDRHGAHLRHSGALGWLVWNGTRWTRDADAEVIRRASETVRSIYTEASCTDDEEERKAIVNHARQSERLPRIKAMVELAASAERVIARPEDFDRDPMLLTCENGTIDLRTGRLRAHDPADLITRLAPVAYDPGASAPLWDAFLDRIMDHRPHLVDFLRRAVGYSLTGDTGEQCFFFDYGCGANGKTTLHETVKRLAGDYALQADFSTFLQKRNEGIPNDIARLDGARFVTSIEADAGRRLAEVVVKQLTGGDTIAARFLHREFFEFRPVCKLWFAANHKPVIRGTDNAIWRRVRLIPFDVTIPEPERDARLGEKLRAELPGILAWAVRGCMEWQALGGLKPPPEVIAATAAYRVEMDTLSTFLDECCRLAPTASVKSADLWRAWQEWSRTNNEPAPARTDLADRLKERGCVAERKPNARLWRGIGLITADPTLSLSGDDA